MTVTAAPTAIHVSAPETSARRRLSYLVFTLCTSLYLLPFMRLLMQGTDEGTLVYGAVRIVHGQVFARDFFEVVGPGTFYWLAMFFKLFGVTFVAARLCLFLTSLGTALLIYFLTRRVCRRYQCLPSILVFGTYFGVVWPTISHHVDSNFFALLSVACIVLWQERRKDILLIAAGVLTGATTCFLQPKGILLLVSILLWLWIQRQRQSASVSALGLLMGGYCSVIGIVLVYFWSRGALSDLVYANAVWPSRHYGAWNNVPYAQYLVKNYWDIWVITKSGFHWTVAMAAVLITPFVFVAALPGLLPILGVWHRRNSTRPEIVLYWLCGGALWLAELHRKDMAHLIFGSPLLIILCVYLLGKFRAKVAESALQILAISASCLVAFNLFLALFAHPLMTRVGSVAMFNSDPAVTFLDEHVVPGEEIFAYPYCPMYYFLSATTNPTRYSILLYNYNTPSQFQEVIRVLDQRKVRYVLWDTKFEAKSVASNFPAAARMPPGGTIIEPYLESHYKLLKAENGVRIMERKSEGHAD
jgi:hypothetical protein